MKTYFTSWNKERGEYQKETETAETLKGYQSGGLYFETELILFAIGGKPEENYCNNWDIYADKKGVLYSIARPKSTCSSTIFGDRNHIKRLIKQDCFSYTLTDYGKQIMEA